jgi:hypothetical protein
VKKQDTKILLVSRTVLVFSLIVCVLLIFAYTNFISNKSAISAEDEAIIEYVANLLGFT